MASSGYSGTPLVKKLGIKLGFHARLIDPPNDYFLLLNELPEGDRFFKTKTSPKDLIHYLTKDAKRLEKDILPLRQEIRPNGMIWISWPKKSSKIETNCTEDVIRNIALRNGLVDIKVCAVDETWSALKLVIPVKLRSSKK